MKLRKLQTLFSIDKETFGSYVSIKEVPCQHCSITLKTAVLTPTGKDQTPSRGVIIRQIQNWKSPLVAAAIFVALVCLPLFGNISFDIVRQATQKKVVLNQMSWDRRGPEAVDDKAHE
jgi:hypothetical protein